MFYNRTQSRTSRAQCQDVSQTNSCWLSPRGPEGGVRECGTQCLAPSPLFSRNICLTPGDPGPFPFWSVFSFFFSPFQQCLHLRKRVWVYVRITKCSLRWFLKERSLSSGKFKDRHVKETEIAYCFWVMVMPVWWAVTVTAGLFFSFLHCFPTRSLKPIELRCTISPHLSEWLDHLIRALLEPSSQGVSSLLGSSPTWPLEQLASTIPVLQYFFFPLLGLPASLLGVTSATWICLCKDRDQFPGVSAQLHSWQPYSTCHLQGPPQARSESWGLNHPGGKAWF